MDARCDKLLMNGKATHRLKTKQHPQTETQHQKYHVTNHVYQREDPIEKQKEKETLDTRAIHSVLNKHVDTVVHAIGNNQYMLDNYVDHFELVLQDVWSIWSKSYCITNTPRIEVRKEHSETNIYCPPSVPSTLCNPISVD